jgi:tetratricopeptide (TPR) repeat protein
MRLGHRRLSSRFALALAACVASWSAPRAALADPPAATKTAEELANQAYEEHAAGRYAEAIATYLKAYAISNAGVVLFNIATIYDRKLHERELAIEYYRRYLRAPDAEPAQVQKANERLTALKREAEEAPAPPPPATAAPAPAPAPAPSAEPAPPAVPPAPSPPAQPAEPRPSTGSTLRTAGVVVGIAGLAGVGASMALGLAAKSKNDDANAVCNGQACAGEQGVSLAHDAGTFATASTIAFVAGLALVGGGVAMYVLAPRASTSASVAIAPQLGASSAGVGLCGRF